MEIATFLRDGGIIYSPLGESLGYAKQASVTHGETR
ncbi:hypothetical protein NIES2107_03570 [Nostoc carneum NIES-2107]|nr:hypothetical protein NIES2107_03570 [Nostoc carneum NIES-2107]